VKPASFLLFEPVLDIYVKAMKAAVGLHLLFPHSLYHPTHISMLFLTHLLPLTRLLENRWPLFIPDAGELVCGGVWEHVRRSRSLGCTASSRRTPLSRSPPPGAAGTPPGSRPSLGHAETTPTTATRR
jgi:hypothetical protein